MSLIGLAPNAKGIKAVRSVDNRSVSLKEKAPDDRVARGKCVLLDFGNSAVFELSKLLFCQ